MCLCACTCTCACMYYSLGIVWGWIVVGLTMYFIIVFSRSGSPYTDSHSGSDYSDDEGGRSPGNKEEGAGGGRGKKSGDQFELFEPFSPVNSPDHLFDLSDDELGASKQVCPASIWTCTYTCNAIHVHVRVHSLFWRVFALTLHSPPPPREGMLLKNCLMKKLPLTMRSLTCRR